MTWSTYIGDDLRVRISDGGDLPEKLTLQTLSTLYGVSVTPVRSAVAQLLKEGVLNKQENGRLRINHGGKRRQLSRRPNHAPQPPTDHFSAIARDIVRMSMGGKPVELREQELAQKHGIGTRRAREILHHLAGLGIVEHLPRRGWRLVPFCEASLNEYLDVRRTLETRAMELAMPYLVRADLERIRQENLDQASADGPLVIDNALHRYIIEKANNRYIKSFFAQHHPYFELLLDYETQHPDIERVRQLAVQLHVKIIDALIQGDLEMARSALAEDLGLRHPVVDMFRQAQSVVQAETNGVQQS